MSDNATLKERLLNNRAPAIFEAARMAAARIAELEAERLVLHDKLNAQARELGGERIDAAACIAELEAERDRLAKALEPFARSYDGIKRDHPDWLTMDFISDYFTPAEFAAARAAIPTKTDTPKTQLKADVSKIYGQSNT